jgi:hypothetical protein
MFPNIIIFFNAGAGHNEIKQLENGSATGSEGLTRKLSAESKDRSTKEPADISVLDVSQTRSCYSKNNLK